MLLLQGQRNVQSHLNPWLRPKRRPRYIRKEFAAQTGLATGYLMNDRDDSYYRILLDNEWQLDDLYRFSHSYSQTYAFIYCFDVEHTPHDRARIGRALETYPWQGGYSYVNIYTVLQNQISVGDRLE
jgi:hypothetical protein